MLVEDDPITVGSIDTDNLIGDIDVSGNLNVQGTLTAGNLHVEELTSTQKVTQNIDFHAQAGTLEMMGMQWRKDGEATKQIVWRGDRFYVSNTVDLHRNAVIEIDNIPVLSADRLGVTVKHSELENVGTLNNLRTSGDLNIDDNVSDLHLVDGTPLKVRCCVRMFLYCNKPYFFLLYCSGRIRRVDAKSSVYHVLIIL